MQDVSWSQFTIITWKNSSANGNNIQSIFIANANSEVKHKFTSRVKSWKCVEKSTPGSIYPKRRAQPVKKAAHNLPGKHTNTQLVN